MGRPLFSQSPSVAVRVEPVVVTPPAEQPVCERWTYWNPFDPDSEEFFSNEVYEAFVDPLNNTIADRGPSPIEDSSSASSSDDESMDESAPRTGVIPHSAVDEGVGIRITEDAIEAIVVRRVNEESQERLRRDLNQPATGPRTIVPIPITAQRVPPSAPPAVIGRFASSPAVDVTPRLHPRRVRDLSSSPMRMTRPLHVAV